jgi:hypothetical protein
MLGCIYEHYAYIIGANTQFVSWTAKSIFAGTGVKSRYHCKNHGKIWTSIQIVWKNNSFTRDSNSGSGVGFWRQYPLKTDPWDVCSEPKITYIAWDLYKAELLTWEKLFSWRFQLMIFRWFSLRQWHCDIFQKQNHRHLVDQIELSVVITIKSNCQLS